MQLIPLCISNHELQDIDGVLVSEFNVMKKGLCLPEVLLFLVDGDKVFQNNLHVLFFELVRDKSQVDIFPDELLLLWSQLFSVFLEVIVSIVANGGNVFLSDLLVLVVLEILGIINLLIAGEIKGFSGCVDHWDVDETIHVWGFLGGALCQ